MPLDWLVLESRFRACEKIRKSSGAGVSPAFWRSRKPGISAAVRVGGGQDARATHQFFHTLFRGNDEKNVKMFKYDVSRQWEDILESPSAGGRHA
jgi:hypothetical protein